MNDKIKELIELGEKDLAFQLLLSQGPDNGDTHNVMGTICWDGPNPQIESFFQVKSWEDLDCLKGMKLRHRFNSNRRYKCFGIKVTDQHFESLQADLYNDPDAFAKWIISLNLNYFRI